MSTYRLTGSELTSTRDKIDAVNRRCVRLGIPPVTLEATAVRIWVHYSEHGTREESETPKSAPWFPMTLHDVTITGGRPALEGYTLLALVEWLEGGAVVRTVPDVDATGIDHAALVEGRCDHCGIDRCRTKVYLVRETGTGRILQVGTTCAQNYLGMSVTPIFESFAPSRDEESLGGRGGRADAPTVVAVAVALADIADRGFVPASTTYGMPTKEVVTATLWPSGRDDDRGAPMGSVDAQISRATEIVAHFAETEPADDFGWNLRSIARSEWLTVREAGMVAAMPAAYDRATGRTLAREARETEQAASEYLGTVGGRLTVTGTVRKIVELEAYSYYGPAPRMVILATETGCLVKWTTTAAIRTELREGQTLTIEGPVKAHDDHGYGRQTVIGGKGGRVKASILRDAVPA